MSEPLCRRDPRPVCLLGDDLTQHSEMERTSFLLEYIQNIELRKRIHAGLNKGEARNALARAVFFNG